MITLVIILGARLVGHDLREEFYALALISRVLDFFLYLVIILAVLW
jgi:hypothetical protein